MRIVHIYKCVCVYTHNTKPRLLKRADPTYFKLETEATAFKLIPRLRMQGCEHP